MAAQVIVKLIADPTGLQPGVEALESLGQIDKSTADQFKSTNKAFQDRAKVVDQSVASTEKFVNATKKLSESIVGGAIGQVNINIEKLNKNIDEGTKHSASFTAALKLAQEQLAKLKPDTAEFQKLNNEITAATKSFEQLSTGTKNPIDRLKELNKTLQQLEADGLGGTEVFQGLKKEADSLGTAINNSGEKFRTLASVIEQAKAKLGTLQESTPEFDKLTSEIEAAELAIGNFTGEATSSRAQLRQYREALLQLEDAGLDGTQVFQEMAEAAGELQDAIGDTSARIQALGSDTFALDAGVQVIQGVAGAFSVAQGAAALFGDESKELQQALLKVNAAMAILQGITQIQTILQSESSASIAVGIALQRIQALQTNIQAAAESRFILIRYGAIVAQKALNVVMALNPAGALLLTISAVAGALLYFTSNSDKAAEANERLNQELESQNEVLKLNSASFERNTALRVAEAKANGDLASAISQLEKEGLQRRAKDLAENIKLNQKRLETLKNTNEEIISINKALDADQQELANLNNQGKIKQIEIENTLADEANKSATASAQARIAQAKKDSQTELNASIAAIIVRQREELAAEGLTQGERELIVANNERAISDIRLQIQQKNLDDQIALAQAHAVQQKNGYRKLEADIQVVILRAQKETLGKNKAQATLIEAEKNEAIKNLRKQLFKDLETIEVTEYRRSKERQQAFNKEVLKEEVLAGAQQASARLQAKQQRNQEEQDRDKDKIEKAKVLRQRLIEAELGLASSLASSLNEIARNQSDKELSIIQATQDKKLEALKQQLDQGTITQDEYNRRALQMQEEFDRKTRAIKIRAAQQEKQLALFQAFIAQSLAVLSILKDQTIPFTIKPVFVALAINQALAQVAAIAAKPIPAFKKGTKSKPFDGPGLIGEAGPELFQVNGKWGYAAGPMVIDMPKGSKVIPTLETDKIMQRYNMTMPPVRQDIVMKSTSTPIDYDKLARKFGIEMGKLPLHVSGFDKNGPYEYTTTVQSRMNYLKGRYGSR